MWTPGTLLRASLRALPAAGAFLGWVTAAPPLCPAGNVPNEKIAIWLKDCR